MFFWFDFVEVESSRKIGNNRIKAWWLTLKTSLEIQNKETQNLSAGNPASTYFTLNSSGTENAYPAAFPREILYVVNIMSMFEPA